MTLAEDPAGSPPRPGEYPARSRRRDSINALRPGRKTWIAGRLLFAPGEGWVLRDASGSVPLRFVPKVNPPSPESAGDLCEIEGEFLEGGFEAARLCRLAPGSASVRPGGPNACLWNLDRGIFRERRLFKDALRRFFLEQDFEEVESPILVRAPGQEPYLDPFRTRLEAEGRAEDRFLITSPEYFHKRLLAAGHERIFEVARVFRNGPSELQGLHHPEFLMVEWYRAYASYLEIMKDLEDLVSCLASGSGIGCAQEVPAPFERLPVSEAFRRFAGVDLDPYLAGDPSFAVREAEEGRFGVRAADDPDTRYFKILVSGVEPRLGLEGPVFLLDFPAAQSALAKIREDDKRLCERFELYIEGVELANGFTELNDPVEQEVRFRHEAAQRAARGGAPVPVDDDFLEALRLGMPPAGGVAVGFDRLFMVLTGRKNFKECLPFACA
jgi:lysyl-tRNA synthetase class 2